MNGRHELSSGRRPLERTAAVRWNPDVHPTWDGFVEALRAAGFPILREDPSTGRVVVDHWRSEEWSPDLFDPDDPRSQDHG